MSRKGPLTSELAEIKSRLDTIEILLGNVVVNVIAIRRLPWWRRLFGGRDA